MSSTDPGLESLYREVILDHYKNPRGHGVIEDADAEAEGQNPLCGDEVSIYVAFGEDGETIEDVKFSGRGCAISQAATSMLMEMAKGRTAERGRRARQGRAARRDRRPAHSGPAQVRDARPHDAQGRAAQGEGDAAPRRSRRLRRARTELGVPDVEVAAADEFPPGSSKIVRAREPLRRRLQLRRRAVRDRGSLLARRRPALRGRLGRGSLPGRLPAARLAFDLATGTPRSLPATEPVETYPVRVVDGTIVVELP